MREHNAEFNPCSVVEPSRKRSSNADSVGSKRQKLEGLEAADLAELMKAGPVSIAEHTNFILLLAPAANADSVGSVWISSKCDMELSVDEILFSFGPGRRRMV
jgi:hypothetical protein